MEHYILVSSNSNNLVFGSTNFDYSVALPVTLQLDHKRWRVALIDTTCQSNETLIICCNVCQNSHIAGKYLPFLKLVKANEVLSQAYYIPLRISTVDSISIKILRLDAGIPSDIEENVMLLHFKQLPL